MANAILEFIAEDIEAEVEEFSSEDIIYTIYFGQGDPEQGGHSWNFSRAFNKEDCGVCTVKEIQQCTLYGGITHFEISKKGIVCEFEKKAAKETGISKLLIHYNISDELWLKLCKTADKVFFNENYYKRC